MQIRGAFVAVAAVVAAAAASVRKRRAQADVDELWRQATADPAS